MVQEGTRKGLTCGSDNQAKTGKINEMQGERNKARHSTQTANAFKLLMLSMQHQYTIQLAHAFPQECIRMGDLSKGV